jgi:hypothetical protein
MSGGKLWVTAGLAILINGGSLLGIGQGSAGGLARSIECRHEIAHNIERARAQKMVAGNPPQRSGAVFEWALATPRYT